MDRPRDALRAEIDAMLRDAGAQWDANTWMRFERLLDEHPEETDDDFEYLTEAEEAAGRFYRPGVDLDTTCLRCGSADLTYHLWGYPAFDAIEELEARGFIVEIHGCCPPLIGEEAFRWVCNRCGDEWGRRV